MICRSELKRLQGQQDYPSISLLAPTHRTAPANKRDRIVVKNLVAEGLERLHGEFKKREVAALVQNLNKLVDRVDWEHSARGPGSLRGQGRRDGDSAPLPGESAGRDRRHVRDARSRLHPQSVPALPRSRADREADAAVRRDDQRPDRIHHQALPDGSQGAGRSLQAPGRPGDQSIGRAGRVAPAVLPQGGRRPRRDPEGRPRPGGGRGRRSLPRVLPGGHQGSGRDRRGRGREP